MKQNILYYILFIYISLDLKHFSLGKSRQKRLIVFPRDASFIQMVLGFGLPFEVDKQSVTYGPFVKSVYYLPRNSTDYTNPNNFVSVNEVRRKRAASRFDFYKTLSSSAEYLGYGGKSCVLRTICETAEVPFSENSDIFTEIFHVIFTPSTTLEPVDENYDYEYLAAEKLGKNERNCAQIFHECKINLMDSFTQIFSHLL